MRPLQLPIERGWQVLPGDARALPLEDESVACVVTSPPYNASIAYEGYDDSIDWDEYIALANDACQEMFRVLVSGGRAWINVVSSVPVVPKSEARVNLGALWANAATMSGFHHRDVVIWRKDMGYGGSCAWGSWQSPSAPNLRGLHEVVLSVYKDTWKRKAPDQYDGWRDNDGIETPWPELASNVWLIRPQPGQERDHDHPAPFPIELPKRCIRLSTWPGETVLDPFAGSGTTLRAAHELQRNPVGFDVDASKGSTT